MFQTTQGEVFGQTKNHSTTKSKEIKMQSNNTLINYVCFIDKFDVPKNSVEEFKQKMNSNANQGLIN